MTWMAMGGIMLFAALGQSDGENVFGQAQWLRDPLFVGVDVIDVYHKEKLPAPKLFGPQNVHTLFRKDITLREKPKQALLTITGDDYYKFYIGGQLVVQGPEAGYPAAHPYYWLDVTDFLRAGTNCLASHSYYQGQQNRVWNSADNRSGFMLRLQVRYANDEEESFVTDGSWRSHTLNAFPTGETIGYKTQYSEDIDLRKIPQGWRETGFEADDWEKPLIGFQDHRFVQQITPPLQRYRVDPVITKEIEEGRYFYDFGGEIVGHTRIRIQGENGKKLTVRHGEELTEDGEVRFEMRASCKYEEKPVLTGQEDLIEFYDYRAFRYIEILDAPTEPEVWVEVRHHPFDSEKSGLQSSDKLLEDIWKMCSRGVQMGAQGGFLDCPSREKGAYLGDAVITGRSHLWLTADASLNRKTLVDFMHSKEICPGLMAVAPGSFMQEIAEYSLQYPMVLWEYYRHTGDKAFLKTIRDDVFEGLFAYFAARENEAGLLENIQEKWVLVDWPENLRDDYDYELANAGENTVLNAFYYGALRKAAQIERELGRDGRAYDEKANTIEKNFAERFVDIATGLYRDAPDSLHSSLHANAIPLAFGLTKGADKTKMLNLIREKKLSCGVYIASYVIEACFKAGAGDLAYQLITSKDEHSWNEMIKHGATTCMEAWGPDQKWNTSWCHPWSSSPIYLIAEYVMGISPGQAGWAKIRIAPAAIENLPEITLHIPHPQGRVTAQFIPGQGYNFTVPQGVPVEVDAPEGMKITVEPARTHLNPELRPEDQAQLNALDWDGKVGEGLGVWIAVERQMLYVLENKRPVWQVPCATSAWGTGALENSNKTPLGWHHVDEKLGEDAPWGQVFRARKATAEIWAPGQETEEDLVLSRILWLQGDEAGRNQGTDPWGRLVDSKQRHIYIHGTNGEDKIGTPSSHGCIRLRNDDALAAFDKIPLGTPVLISERALQ
jgi:alpha-L-rhamnosidase